MIYFDFSKAFDRINLYISYQQAQTIRCHITINWLAHFICKTPYFRVSVSFTFSKAMECPGGVRQGSLLGTFLDLYRRSFKAGIFGFNRFH